MYDGKYIMYILQVINVDSFIGMTLICVVSAYQPSSSLLESALGLLLLHWDVEMYSTTT